MEGFRGVICRRRGPVAIVMVMITAVWVLSTGRARRQPPAQYTGCADKDKGSNVKKDSVEG